MWAPLAWALFGSAEAMQSRAKTRGRLPELDDLIGKAARDAQAVCSFMRHDRIKREQDLLYEAMRGTPHPPIDKAD